MVATRKKLSWIQQAWLILRKDLQIEASTGEIVTTSAFFALLIVVISSLAFFGGPRSQVVVAPGVIWVSTAFASVLALSRTWQRERENDALNGLLAMPIHRSAVFAGKAAGVCLFMAVIEFAVVLLTALLFDVSLLEMGLGLVILCSAATPGIAAAGTLFGAMTVRTSARDLILASVLFPLTAPTLLAAVAGTRALFDGAPLTELTDYVMLMVMFAVIFISGGLGMFGSLIEG